MKKITTIIIVSIFLQISPIYSQSYNIDELKNWQLKSYAESAMRQNDTYSAIEFYEEYHNRCNYDYNIDLKLANLYIEANNYQKAKEIYWDLYKIDSVKYLIPLYNYAEILKTEMKYVEAITYFEKFRKEAKKELKGNEKEMYMYLSAIQLQGCQYALENLKKDKTVYVTHLNTTINKAHLETAPLIYNDTTLIYSSMVVDSVPIVKIDESYKAPKNQFYAAVLKNNEWQGGFSAPKPFYNFDSLHTANGVFSKDKKRFYFTSTHKNKMNKNISHIYVSTLEYGIWQKPYKLNKKINLKNHNSTQPAIGDCYIENYEIIYFISDRPKGKGGMDIWFTIYDTKMEIYKKPVNAGGFINSISNEITPFYCYKDTTLYYSSDGLPGFGGFDIFKAKGWAANWEQAENMGFPINSSFNDIYFSQEPNRQNGFIVSNRNGSIELNSPNCCYDIFEFAIIKETKKDTTVLSNKDSLYTTNNIVTETQTKQDTAITSINKKLEDYIITTINSNTTNNSNSVIINNLYFDYNSPNLRTSSMFFLDITVLPLMQKYKNISVEISAHTDGKGSYYYNMELSKHRAFSVSNYLISKGIERKRIKSVGYGETKPIAKEIDRNGNDLPEGRQINRRIEFKIIGVKK